MVLSHIWQFFVVLGDYNVKIVMCFCVISHTLDKAAGVIYAPAFTSPINLRFQKVRSSKASSAPSAFQMCLWILCILFLPQKA
jgi:hypothetical protein